MGKKSYFFFHGFSCSEDKKEDKRITVGKNFRIEGGASKEQHEYMSEFTQEFAKEVQKDPPQTPGETNMIVRDVRKKVGTPPKQED